ncbi:MAG: hypothetical protein U0136_16970 [Bdellovibrionota bacterium]
MIGSGKQSKVEARRAVLCLRLCATLALALCAGTGCAKHRITPETQYLSEDHAARVPAGVVRYCWEEPMVQLEPNGPGVDAEGYWYHPSYLAVREVRQGKWRPCRPVPSELKGETRNER